MHSWEQPGEQWEGGVADLDVDHEALEKSLTPRAASEKCAEALVEEWASGHLPALPEWRMSWIESRVRRESRVRLSYHQDSAC